MNNEQPIFAPLQLNLNPYSTLVHQHNGKKSWLLIDPISKEVGTMNAELIDEEPNGDQHYRIDKLATVSAEELGNRKSFMGRTVRNRKLTAKEILKYLGVGGKLYADSDLDESGKDPKEIALNGLDYLDLIVEEEDILSVVKQTIGLYKVTFDSSKGRFDGSVVIDFNFSNPLNQPVVLK